MPCYTGFGNLSDKRPFFTGDFNGDGKNEILFYRVGGGAATAFLSKAAADKRAPVRVAVAVAAGQRPIVLPDATLIHLLNDTDVGVRKFAPQAVKPENGTEPRAVLTRVAKDDAREGLEVSRRSSAAKAALQANRLRHG